MFGQNQFSDINAHLNGMFAERGTLIAVHRGQPGGMLQENTIGALIAAERSGGDLVEMDVLRSRDGDYFMFHDGQEPQRFGFNHSLETFTSDEIAELSYEKRTKAPFYRVTRLDDLLDALPDRVILNIDRSWRYWADSDLLPWLGKRDLAPRLLMKVDAADAEAFEAARRAEVKFPLLPIASTVEQLDPIIRDPDLNVIGVEFVARDSSHPFCDREWIQGLRASGIFSYVNGLDLGNGLPMYAGWDDSVAILNGADAGWGPIVDRGVDVIQTDFTALLDEYLCLRGVRTRTPLHVLQTTEAISMFNTNRSAGPC
ncbi:glycerophosphodiester phosphodiesterase family protein [Arthrobacter sp. StoSoilB5]|uniref:glycerophosphodiester phosphodiesterase family protein n=1 Tax=Arthrobacter sp. StoSoilB5 TaxID=2830992 RepID=UPI001CC4352D|nr:glycerophosphodiester phosphodiesterase family protein [Arthrobacter sp. StoSoilB5]BCW44742.1 hypothetical protein StoSoilB5_19260 [Arthrobacter sp. StoSoilB5]